MAMIPLPPIKKRSGPEGLGAYIVELLIAGRRADASAVWRSRIDRGRYCGLTVGEMLVHVSHETMPTPGVRSSANYGVAASCAWALMVLYGLLPWTEDPLTLLERYARWCLGPDGLGLYSAEVLSDVYGWVLHLLGCVLAAIEGVEGRGPHLRQLLEAHLWLLERLLVAGAGTGRGRVSGQPDIDVRHDPVVWCPGERSPPERHTGAVLTSWLRWVTHQPDPLRGRTSDRAWASWWARLTRSRPPVLEAVDHGARLAVTIEVTRRADDYSARIIRSLRGLTEPTMAVSYVGGRLYVADPGVRNRRAPIMTTRRAEEGIVVCDASGEPLDVRIPAPSLAHGETWHSGPGGYAEGPAEGEKVA